jgi:hypothetical protein
VPGPDEHAEDDEPADEERDPARRERGPAQGSA